MKIMRDSSLREIHPKKEQGEWVGKVGGWGLEGAQWYARSNQERQWMLYFKRIGR